MSKNGEKMKSELIDRVLEWRDVVLIDFENYQCIPTDLLNEDYVYYLFCGSTTTKCANAYKEMLNAYDINIIETKHVGTNFVDNRISMYIGYIFGKYSTRQVILVSNDIDYYEMYMDLKSHGYPIIYREPSLTCKEYIRRQSDYLLGNPMSKPNPQNSSNKEADALKELTSFNQKMDLILKKIEELNQHDDIKSIVENIMELNKGNPIVASSKMTHYLRNKMNMSKVETNKVLNQINTKYVELVETRGKEKFYKILLQ